MNSRYLASFQFSDGGNISCNEDMIYLGMAEAAFSLELFTCGPPFYDSLSNKRP